MADITQFIKKYNQYKTSFKKTSFDDNNKIYLCNDETQNVINFDEIIKVKYPNSNQRPKSFDALYFYNNLIFCIEFKNQKPSQIDNIDIQDKLLNGKKELLKLFQELNIQAKDYNFIYCVVYKKCIEPRERYKCGIDKGKILFGLKKFEKQGFIKKIYTDNVNFFTKQFRKNLKKELIC